MRRLPKPHKTLNAAPSQVRTCALECHARPVLTSVGTVEQMLYVTNQAVFERRMHVSMTGAVVLLLVMAAGGAWADSPDAGGLDEVLVNAQRRAENLQTVPIAITAVSGQAMAEGGVHDLGTLAANVPGLTFSPFSQDQNILSIRGVSSNDGGAGTDSSVTVFVDDVYLGRISDINPEMFDVERVEVLRGP